MVGQGQFGRLRRDRGPLGDPVRGGVRPRTSEAACGTRPECRQLPAMVYDPVNERLVVYGGGHRGPAATGRPDDVLAFDTRTGEWTVLLAPREPVAP